MKRKDCGNYSPVYARESARQSARAARLMVSVALAVGLLSSESTAGTVRLWPSAVVVDDTVVLADVAELKAFDNETERKLAGVVVTHAPPPGGSRIVHMEMIRSTLAAGGANMATVTLSGATQCTLTRPANISVPADEARARLTVEAPRIPAPRRVGGETPAKPLTLRQAVIDYFNHEFARYGGRADVVFDRTSQQVLELSGPTYQFRVRRRGGSPLGLTQLEVVVVADGRAVQTVPLVVQVTMIRRVVVARRSVNQDATIRASDVELVPVSFTRLDKLGMDNTAQAVGQRVKRFIAAGSVLDPAMLESVPLVMRGQLVTLTSVAGATRVVTTSKAMKDGLLGETITVRAADNRRVELDAVVVGPGAVQIGSGPAGRRITRIAMGDQP